MRVHKESYKILRNQIIVYLLLGFITLFNITFLYYITPLFLIIFVFCLYFFRIPKRIFLPKENIIYAPCDGKVVIIKKVVETEYYKDERIQISIFMSPLNVHNQLYPINGEIIYQKYHPGKYLVAWHPKSSLLNERNSIVVKNNNTSILFRQIAGAVARRIVSYAHLGATINACDEAWFIKFGSRVDVFIEKDQEVNVKLGDTVTGGKTIIGAY